jgi:hypothetical protein
MDRFRFTIARPLQEATLRSAIILSFCVFQLPACASTSEFSAYRAISGHHVRDERVFLKCREHARHVVTGAARGLIENIPDGK